MIGLWDDRIVVLVFNALCPEGIGESERELFLYLDLLLFVYSCVIVKHLQGESGA